MPNLLNFVVAVACQEEEEKLRNENENLKKDVNDLKNRLVATEIQNGGRFLIFPTFFFIDILIDKINLTHFQCTPGPVYN